MKILLDLVFIVWRNTICILKLLYEIFIYIWNIKLYFKKKLIIAISLLRSPFNLFLLSIPKVNFEDLSSVSRISSPPS